MADKVRFTPVVGLDDKIKLQPKIEGRVYFATDTRKIYLDTDKDNKLSVGGAGNSGIYYGTKAEVSDEEFAQLENPSNRFKFNIKGFIKYLSNKSNRMDAALTHSGFLSAATDNAKELILKKVNADAKFAGIYAYLISTGHTFTEIAEIMTSPIFDEISRLSETNLFLPYTKGFSLQTALD
jgi:hypothetical protein